MSSHTISNETLRTILINQHSQGSAHSHGTHPLTYRGARGTRSHPIGAGIYPSGARITAVSLPSRGRSQASRPGVAARIITHLRSTEASPRDTETTGNTRHTWRRDHASRPGPSHAAAHPGLPRMALRGSVPFGSNGSDRRRCNRWVAAHPPGRNAPDQKGV